MFLTLPINRINSVSYLIEQIPNWKNLDAIFVSNFNNQNANIEIIEKSEDCRFTLSYSLKQIKFDMWVIEWIEVNGFRKTYSSSPLGKSVYVSCKQVA